MANLDLQLNPDMRADQAVRTILLHLLEIMQANQEGLKAGLDPEFIHDYRVAVRRTRTILSQIRGVLPQRKQDRFRREFFWIGQITSPIRDMDILLIRFIALKNSLPLSLQEGINPFYDFLKSQRGRGHLYLTKLLSSARYRKLISDWRTYLESPLPEHSSLTNAMRPTIVVANKRIWKMVRRVMSEGKMIQPNSPPEDWHELRKSCKKLRYLMESFINLYSNIKIKRLINKLKELQDLLGEYQDLNVQLTYLKMFPSQMVAEGVIREKTMAALDLIIKITNQRQAKIRKLFKTRFTTFSDKNIFNNFSKLFDPKFQKK